MCECCQVQEAIATPVAALVVEKEPKKEPYKMYILARTNKEYSRGKLMVHAAHVCTDVIMLCGEGLFNKTDSRIEEWYRDNNQTKIILAVGSDEDIINMVTQAQEDLRIPSAYTTDAGFKEVEKGEVICGAILANKTEAKKLGLTKLKIFS